MTYDSDRNGAGCYSLAIAARREMGVRHGDIAPLTADERRQAAEGPVEWRALDCVRQGAGDVRGGDLDGNGAAGGGAAVSAWDRQEGGSHYRDMAISPTRYILENGLGWCEGNVVKYVSRWRRKGGVADLVKARHYLDLLIEEAAPSGDTAYRSVSPSEDGESGREDFGA